MEVYALTSLPCVDAGMNTRVVSNSIKTSSPGETSSVGLFDWGPNILQGDLGLRDVMCYYSTRII